MLMAMSAHGKIGLQGLKAGKHAGRPFSVLTCYDAPMARLMEQAGVEVLLVGDTAGEVILGLPTTKEVPAEFMIALTAAVRRGAPETFVMADLPYLCRVEGEAATVRWCQRFRDESGCDAVKVEVAGDEAALVSAIGDAGVPVVAHLGLLPQAVDAKSGYRAQARDAEGARKLMEDARRLEQAGAVMLLLEAVASEVTREIANRTELPVIGCVAGPHCDGTVVVLHDMIGLGGGHPPRAVKRYENLSEVLTRAFQAYVEDIHARRFPTDANAIHMKEGEYDKLLTRIGDGP